MYLHTVTGQKNTVYSELCPKITDKSGVETNEII